MECFYLGTHRPSWLARTSVPLFLSFATMCRQRVIPRARGPWAGDSSGFSMLGKHGRWTFGDPHLAAHAVMWAEQADRYPDFFAPRDWMCEAIMLAATGLTIREHQARTIDSFITLRVICPEIRWLPVLQGYAPDDYQDHAEQYEAAGVDLAKEPRVGVGSVCRRQSTREGAEIFERVASLGIRAHAFGVKVGGIKLYGDKIASADSMAWSSVARKRGVLLARCRSDGKHVNCANCQHWALEWKATRIDGAAPAQALTIERP